MTTPTIKVTGLREFRKQLRTVDRDLPKGLRLAGNAAAQIIVDWARPRVPIGPGKGGHARDSIKVASTGKAVRVQGGGKRYPYYPWLDFGGRVGRGRGSTRPFLKTGRYIWAAYASNDKAVAQRLESELLRLATRAGLRPTGGS